MSGDLPFTRAVATVRLAVSFADASGRQPLDAKPPSFVTFFLMGHALELGWKSVLIVEGVTDKALRAIGHDLLEARERAESILDSDVATTPQVAAISEMMAGYYKAKALEYVQPGFYSFPEPRQAFSAVSEYTDLLRAWVERRVRARLENGDSPRKSRADDDFT
ncbi:hypothetical protein [Gaopeijia maritima]|uniref:HEPN domain-containing protein n=1 Tax=Gaopeijia maritima TaxID=3119007 RepID=A0ABU9EAD6_9BACT